MGDQEWSVVLWYMISIAEKTATRPIVLLCGFFGTYSYWMVKLGFLFLFWHCALPLSLGVVECWEWDLFKFMKSVIPPTHLKKEDTFIDNENVIEFYTYVHSWQSWFRSHESMAVCQPRFVGKTSQSVEQPSFANKYSVKEDTRTVVL